MDLRIDICAEKPASAPISVKTVSTWMRPPRLISVAISIAAMVRPITSRSGSIGNIRDRHQRGQNGGYGGLSRGDAPRFVHLQECSPARLDPDRQWNFRSRRGY